MSLERAVHERLANPPDQKQCEPVRQYFSRLFRYLWTSCRTDALPGRPLSDPASRSRAEFPRVPATTRVLSNFIQLASMQNFNPAARRNRLLWLLRCLPAPDPIEVQSPGTPRTPPTAKTGNSGAQSIQGPANSSRNRAARPRQATRSEPTLAAPERAGVLE